MPLKQQQQQQQQQLQVDVQEVDAADILALPPDGGFGWVVTAACALNLLIVDGIANGFGFMLLDMCQHFAAEKTAIALVGSLLCGMYQLNGPVAGSLVNRFNCRAVCIAGAVMSAIGFVASSFCPNVLTLTLSYGFVAGFGFGLISLPSTVCVSFYFERRRAIAVGLALCGSGIGSVVMGPAIALLLRECGLQNTFVLLGAVVLQCAVAGAFMRPVIPRIDQQQQQQQQQQQHSGLEQQQQQSNGDDQQNEFDNKVSSTFSIDVLARQYVQQQLHQQQQQALAKIAFEQQLQKQQQQQQQQPKEKVNDDDDCKIFASTVSNISSINQKQTSTLVGDAAKQTAQMLRSMPSLFVIEQSRKGGRQKRKAVARAQQFDIQQLMNGVSTAKIQDLQRPLYRKDIFYSGSVNKLAGAVSKSSLCLSMTRIPGRDEIDQSTLADGLQHQQIESGDQVRCSCLPKSLVDAFLLMTDLHVLRNPAFAILCLANAIAMLAFYVPLFFAKDFAQELGLSDDRAAHLLVAFGAANSVGRATIGPIATVRGCTPLLLHNTGLCVSGFLVLLLPHCTQYWSLLTVYTAIGFSLAPFIALTSELLCQLVGIDKLTSAVGVVTLARGISSIAGSPLMARLYSEQWGYTLPFCFGGSLFVLSSLLMCSLALPQFVKQREVIKAEAAAEFMSLRSLATSMVLVERTQLLASSTVDLRSASKI